MVPTREICELPLYFWLILQQTHILNKIAREFCKRQRGKDLILSTGLDKDGRTNLFLAATGNWHNLMQFETVNDNGIHARGSSFFPTTYFQLFKAICLTYNLLMLQAGLEDVIVNDITWCVFASTVSKVPKYSWFTLFENQILVSPLRKV